MPILNKAGQQVTSEKTLDNLPIMSCQAMRPQSIDDKTLIKCSGQVFLMGYAFKLDVDGAVSGKKNGIYPQQVEVCAVCGALNSKGIDKEAEGFNEAIKK